MPPHMPRVSFLPLVCVVSSASAYAPSLSFSSNLHLPPCPWPGGPQHDTRPRNLSSPETFAEAASHRSLDRECRRPNPLHVVDHAGAAGGSFGLHACGSRAHVAVVAGGSRNVGSSQGRGGPQTTNVSSAFTALSRRTALRPCSAVHVRVGQLCRSSLFAMCSRDPTAIPTLLPSVSLQPTGTSSEVALLLFSESSGSNPMGQAFSGRSASLEATSS